MNPDTDTVQIQFLNPLKALGDYTPEQFLQVQFYFLNDDDPDPQWVSTERCGGTANRYCPKLTAEEYYLQGDPVNYQFGRSLYAVVNSCETAKGIAEANQLDFDESLVCQTDAANQDFKDYVESLQIRVEMYG